MVCFKDMAARVAADERQCLISRLESWNDADSAYGQLEEIDELDLVEAADVRFNLRQRDTFSLVTFNALLTEWRTAVQEYPPRQNGDGEWIDGGLHQERAQRARLNLLKWLEGGAGDRLVGSPWKPTVASSKYDAAAHDMDATKAEPSRGGGVIDIEMDYGLTLEEATKLVQCTEGHFSRVVKERNIPRGKFRGQPVFAANAVAAYLRTGRNEKRLCRSKRESSGPAPSAAGPLPQPVPAPVLYRCSKCRQTSTDPRVPCQCGCHNKFSLERPSSNRA